MPQIDRTMLGGPDLDGFISLGRTKTGRLFRKELMTFGTYAHPNIPKAKLIIDQKVADKAIANFQAGIADIVQVPVANDKNEHTEDPNANIGEVIGLEVGTNSKGKQALFCTIDCRDDEAAEKLGKTLIGTSALMHLNYTDTKTGEKVGPTLLHACVTNRPYIAGMDGFEELIAASGKSDEAIALTLMEDEGAPAPIDPEVLEPNPETHPDEPNRTITSPPGNQPEPVEVPPEGADPSLITLEDGTIAATVTDTSLIEPAAAGQLQEDPQMPSFDEIKASLKSEHGVDLDELQALALTATDAQRELAVALSATEEKDNEVAALTSTVTDLSTRLQSTEETLQAQKQAAAEKEVKDLIAAGRILPKQEEAMVALAMNDRPTFEVLLPDTALISLTEHGVTTHDAPAPSEETQAEIDRISALTGKI